MKTTYIVQTSPQTSGRIIIGSLYRHDRNDRPPSQQLSIISLSSSCRRDTEAPPVSPEIKKIKRYELQPLNRLLLVNILNHGAMLSSYLCIYVCTYIWYLVLGLSYVSINTRSGLSCPADYD